MSGTCRVERSIGNTNASPIPLTERFKLIMWVMLGCTGTMVSLILGG